MCGRYGLAVPGRLAELPVGSALLTDALLDPARHASARYNITPSQRLHAVAADADGVRSARLRWGLIPSWAKDASIGQRLANARGETVRTKPAFRQAFAARRALVPADLFYEWQPLEGSRRKQPWCIRMHDAAPFAFAALWERWTPPPAQHATEDSSEEATVWETCTLITTDANELMATIHHRMPVILAAADYDTWLDVHAPHDAVEQLLRPYSASAMQAFRVSAYVNAPAHDDAQCIAPLENDAMS